MTHTMFPLRAGATLSQCGKYRYTLWRVWDESLPTCCFVMHNPSTADGTDDDATIRRCVSFAKKFGCGKLEVVNLFAYRARHPKDMRLADDPIGPHNYEHVIETVGRASIIVAAWGAVMLTTTALDALCRHLFNGKPLKCLGKTKKVGQPRHPLFVPHDTELQDYTWHHVLPNTDGVANEDQDQRRQTVRHAV